MNPVCSRLLWSTMMLDKERRHPYLETGVDRVGQSVIHRNRALSDAHSAVVVVCPVEHHSVRVQGRSNVEIAKTVGRMNEDDVALGCSDHRWAVEIRSASKTTSSNIMRDIRPCTVDADDLTLVELNDKRSDRILRLEGGSHYRG